MSRFTRRCTGWGPTIGAVLASALALAAHDALAQKNHMDGGDMYGGAHADGKSKASLDAARPGKFDLAPGDTKRSSRADLAHTPQKPDAEEPARSGAKGTAARSSKFDPHTEGTRAKP